MLAAFREDEAPWTEAAGADGLDLGELAVLRDAERDQTVVDAIGDVEGPAVRMEEDFGGVILSTGVVRWQRGDGLEFLESAAAIVPKDDDGGTRLIEDVEDVSRFVQNQMARTLKRIGGDELGLLQCAGRVIDSEHVDPVVVDVGDEGVFPMRAELNVMGAGEFLSSFREAGQLNA